MKLLIEALGYLETDIGIMQVTANDAGITSILFVSERLHTENSNAIVDSALSQLAEYYAGRRQEFDLPLAPKGTDFQKKVWQQLCTIPFGTTCSYRDIAIGLGKPTAMRAVGSANGKNPISIVVPCHRVIGANGTLTGYAGGLERKAALLALEAPQLSL